MKINRTLVACTLALSALSLPAFATSSSSTATTMTSSMVEAGLDPAVLDEALKHFEEHQSAIANQRYIGIIDYTLHSRVPRFFLFDTVLGTTERMHVAHGAGSDLDHDGRPEAFSNRPGSRMTSLGAYVTAETYHGRHGLSLRLDGLSATNSKARERAIVIHGADYVSPLRGTLGRSWGCPAVERTVSAKLIEKIKGGAFLYVHGAEGAVEA